jgi:hypothetical protein
MSSECTIIILDVLFVDSDVWIIIYIHGISTGLRIVLLCCTHYLR